MILMLGGLKLISAIFKKITGFLPGDRKRYKSVKVNASTLRNAGIDALPKDERWNRLFSFINKTPSIIKNEQTINALINEKTNLRMENNIINAELDIKETSNERRETLLERVTQIDQKFSDIDDEIKKKNISLLEEASSYLYQYMEDSRARAADLDDKITDAREALKAMISERETLNAAADETYQFLHGLLGVSQIDMIDEQLKNE